LEIKHPVLQLL